MVARNVLEDAVSGKTLWFALGFKQNDHSTLSHLRLKSNFTWWDSSTANFNLFLCEENGLSKYYMYLEKSWAS